MQDISKTNVHILCCKCIKCFMCTCLTILTALNVFIVGLPAENMPAFFHKQILTFTAD